MKLGVLLPFDGFGESWNEANRQAFEEIRVGADYVNYTSSQEYKHPGQLKGNQEFILNHTDGTLLFYESEREGKPKYLLEMIEKYQETSTYELERISFDELQWFVTEYEEAHREEEY